MNTAVSLEERSIKLKKQEEQFKLLGIYYDSREHLLSCVPEKITGTVMVDYTKLDSYGCIKCSLNFKDTGKTLDAHHNFIESLNSYVPDFYIREGKYNPNSQEKYNLHCALTENSEVHRYDLVNKLTFADVLKHYFDRTNLISKKFTIDFTATRHTSTEYRNAVLFEERGKLSPKEFFTQVGDPSVEVTNTSTGYRYNNRYYIRGQVFPKFKGKLKDKIFNLGDKTLTIFLCEYLYGVKMPKNFTYDQIYTKLKGLPYTDLGVKDVRVMLQILDAITSYKPIKSVTKDLIDAGLQPVTDLRRWKKVRQYAKENNLELPEIKK